MFCWGIVSRTSWGIGCGLRKREVRGVQAFELCHWVVRLELVSLCTEMRKREVAGWKGESTEIYLGHIKIEMLLIHPGGR